ncbi:hypothetical protein I7I48_08403 [Histoplasma ohiense]|nr:hypothetical protein I7I48_08403 [Histoplasma ohiense (nom. inval.)]
MPLWLKHDTCTIFMDYCKWIVNKCTRKVDIRSV